MSSTYEEPELADIAPPSVCKVKLIRNTRGVNWEITVVESFDDGELVRIRDAAIAQHRFLEQQFPDS